MPATWQTSQFGLGQLRSDLGAIWARADSGLPVLITATMQWEYDPARLRDLWMLVESTQYSDDVTKRTFYPARNVIDQIAYSALVSYSAKRNLAPFPSRWSTFRPLYAKYSANDFDRSKSR